MNIFKYNFKKRYIALYKENLIYNIKREYTEKCQIIYIDKEKGILHINSNKVSPVGDIINIKYNNKYIKGTVLNNIKDGITISILGGRKNQNELNIGDSIIKYPLLKNKDTVILPKPLELLGNIITTNGENKTHKYIRINNKNTISLENKNTFVPGWESIYTNNSITNKYDSINLKIDKDINTINYNKSLMTGIRKIDMFYPICNGTTTLIYNDENSIQSGRLLTLEILSSQQNREGYKQSLNIIDNKLDNKSQEYFCIYTCINKRDIDIEQIVQYQKHHRILPYTMILINDNDSTIGDIISIQNITKNICKIWQEFYNMNVFCIIDDITNYIISLKQLQKYIYIYTKNYNNNTVTTYIPLNLYLPISQYSLKYNTSLTCLYIGIRYTDDIINKLLYKSIDSIIYIEKLYNNKVNITSKNFLINNMCPMQRSVFLEMQQILYQCNEVLQYEQLSKDLCIEFEDDLYISLIHWKNILNIITIHTLDTFTPPHVLYILLIALCEYKLFRFPASEASRLPSFLISFLYTNYNLLYTQICKYITVSLYTWEPIPPSYRSGLPSDVFHALKDAVSQGVIQFSLRWCE